MTNPVFPVSYKDPVYAAADQAASGATGVPQGLISGIRTVGENSNANQVSSAGATTPYQFTPSTRQLIIQKYNIDPTSSPEAAALGAAYLLKEAQQRTGSWAGAVTQYIGGTDPANWGGQTRAYTNRVMANYVKNGGSDTPQADSTPSAPTPLPSAASYGLDPSVVGFGSTSQPAPGAPTVAAPQAAAPGAGVNQQIVSDYNAGRLSSQDMDAVDQRVQSGKIQIDPSQLQRPAAPAADPSAPAAPANAQPASPQQIGPKTLAAMQAGTLTPDQLQVVQTGLKNGTLTMPPANQVPDVNGPDQSGIMAPGLPASALPSAPMAPVTAAQNNSALSDAVEKGVGGYASGLIGILGAGARMVGANDFADQASAARKQIAAQTARDTNNSTSGKVAGVVGAAVPYLTAPGASLPAAAATGAGAGAVEAIADNKSGGEVARDAATGAVAGIAGHGAGKVAGSIISSIAENPTIAKAIAKTQSFFGGTPSEATNIAAAGGAPDANVAADIAVKSGNTPEQIAPNQTKASAAANQLATKLEAAPEPQTPGYTPTAAEMANDPNVTTVQKASTNANPSIYANASADNDAAISKALTPGASEGSMPADVPVNPGTPAAPQAADQAVEAAAQKSDALAATGQTELPPLPSDVAANLQADQFQSPIKLAKRMASDEGSTVFDDQQAARHADAANTLQQIIGTPDQLEALKTARGAQASDALSQVFNDAKPAQTQPVVDKIDAILDGPSGKRPAVAQSLNAVKNLIVDPTSGALERDPNVLYNSVRKGIDDMIDPKMNTATPAGIQATRELLQVKNTLDQQIDKAAPGFKQYLSDFSDASRPIDAMQSAQQRLYSAVNPATGEIAPAKLINAINSIKAEQMKAGAKAADSVPPETIDALSELAQHLQNKNDLTGLPGEGQEYIRRALASSDKHAAAHEEFKQILNQSPAYAELHGPHAQAVGTVNSAKASQDALFSAQDLLGNASSPADLRKLDKLLPNMEPADQAKAIALRQAKARELAMNEVAERNKNAAGQTEFNRGTFRSAAEKYSPYMAPGEANKFGAVATDLHNQTTSYAKTGKLGGSDTEQNKNNVQKFIKNVGAALKDSTVQSLMGGALGSLVGGPLGSAGGFAAGALSSAITRTISQKVSHITTENAANLLSNGKLLASALRNYESLAARRLFVQQVAQKAGVVTGAVTANQFNGRR